MVDDQPCRHDFFDSLRPSSPALRIRHSWNGRLTNIHFDRHNQGEMSIGAVDERKR